MKRIMTAGLMALLSAAASSAWAAPPKVNPDEALARTLMSNAGQLGVCQAIGFTTDIERFQDAIVATGDRLMASGYSDVSMQGISTQSKAYAAAHLVEFTEESSSDQNTPAGFNKMEVQFAAIQSACDQLYAQPTLTAYITKDAYQATPGKKSFFGLVEFQAKHGDSEKMFLMGSFYDAGIRPDPDHKLAFSWYMRAAEAGNANGADMVGAAYITEAGVALDLIEAEKWAVITESLGGSSFLIDELADGILTPAQQKQGRDLAVAWLEKHE